MMEKMILGLVLFLGTHSVSIFANGWRDAFAARHEMAWKIFVSLASLAGIYLIATGYAEARITSTVLYVPPAALRHLSALLMLPMFIFFFAPYFPGRIKTALKHPQLVAVKIWAFSHLLVNGSVADVVLFGSFLAWAVVDRISLKRRPARTVIGAPAGAKNDVIVIVLGLAAYLGFVFWAHRYLMGVAPFA
jgi:uncharacterized membrane protein